MICPNCGSNNSEGTHFCVGCGAKLESAPPPPAYQPPQAQNYQQHYQQPSYQNIPAVNPNTMPMRTSEFFWMMLILAIPLAGFICTLVWAFGSNVNENRRNLCRAILIWMLVGIVLTIVLGILLAILGFTIGDALASTYYY
jgi:Na+/proline symporter